jgi:hypothetical protein
MEDAIGGDLLRAQAIRPDERARSESQRAQDSPRSV